jgi:hypothetical protein
VDEERRDMSKRRVHSDHAQGKHSSRVLRKGYMRHKYTTGRTVTFPSYAGQMISLEIAQSPLSFHNKTTARRAYLDDVGFGLLVHVRVLL